MALLKHSVYLDLLDHPLLASLVKVESNQPLPTGIHGDEPVVMARSSSLEGLCGTDRGCYLVPGDR